MLLKTLRSDVESPSLMSMKRREFTWAPILFGQKHERSGYFGRLQMGRGIIMSQMEIGAQLYTLRDCCKTLDDFAETLKRVADIGYRTVQVSGTCGYEADWLKEQLETTGLRCVLTHYAVDRIADDTQAVIAEHRVFGCPYIGIGFIPGGLQHPEEDYARFVQRFRPAGAAIAKAGSRLMYHNHHMEFMRAPDGKRYIEKLAEDFAPEELGFTLDTYWVQYAGGDPAQWLEILRGRVPCVHLKDMACMDRSPKMAPVGEGNLNFDRILRMAEQAGTSYLLVEQDDCNAEDPFDCLARSYRYLTAWGLR